MSDISFEQVAFEHPALERLLMEYRSIFLNGGALFGCFDAIGPDLNDWFHELTRDAHPLHSFLVSPAMTAALPELNTQNGVRNPKWQRVGPLGFGGQLGEALLGGGAYAGFQSTYQEAREIGLAAGDAILGDNWQYADIWYSYKPWSAWFRDVAWDYSWVVVHRLLAKVWIICATDTD
jgi:hypothetical protein